MLAGSLATATIATPTQAQARWGWVSAVSECEANDQRGRALMRHYLGSPGMGLIVQSGRIPVE